MTLLDRLWEIILKILPHFIMIRPDELGVYVICGKWVKRVNPGVYPVWTWIIDLQYLCTKTDVNDVEVQSVTTKDFKKVAVRACVRFKVKNPELALYNVNDYEASMQNAIKVEVANYVNKHDLSDCQNLQKSQDAITKEVKKAVYGWGLEIDAVTITDLIEHNALRLFTNERAWEEI